MVFISGGLFATPLNAELKHGGTNVIGAMYVPAELSAGDTNSPKPLCLTLWKAMAGYC
jgi:hypothetical protein